MHERLGFLSSLVVTGVLVACSVVEPTPSAGVGIAELLARPLIAPQLPPGPCRLSVFIRTPAGLNSYSEIPESIPLHPQGPRFEEGLAHGVLQKVLWKVAPDYGGPTLIRGFEIGGSSRLLLSSETGTIGQVVRQVEGGGRQWPVFGALAWPASRGARAWPTQSFAEASGCYAYQIDGAGFTQHIVFVVR